MPEYSLIGVDGNAFALLGYTAMALRAEGLSDKIEEMRKEATASDYLHLIATCHEYVELANKEAGNR